jgi:hypothetical protein
LDGHVSPVLDTARRFRLIDLLQGAGTPNFDTSGPFSGMVALISMDIST